MLVIERKSGQEIEIDGPARIRVVRRAGKILLLIDADPEVKVLRGEIAERLRTERFHDPCACLATLDGATLARIDAESKNRCNRCGSCGLLLPPPMPSKCPECHGQLKRDDD